MTLVEDDVWWSRQRVLNAGTMDAVPFDESCNLRRPDHDGRFNDKED